MLFTMAGCAAATSWCSVQSPSGPLPTLYRQPAPLEQSFVYRSRVLPSLDALGYVGPGQLAEEALPVMSFQSP
jgi:hypothetical protein